MNIGQWINSNLGPISVITGIVAFIPILITAWQVTLGESRRRRKWFKETIKDLGETPAVLIIDLFEKAEIRTNVEQFLGREKIKVDKSRVFEIIRNKWLKPEDMPDIAQEIHDNVANIIRAGTDVVHVFYAGPVMPPMLIGVQLVTCRALLYQWDKNNSTFVCWGPLHYT